MGKILKPCLKDPKYRKMIRDVNAYFAAGPKKALTDEELVQLLVYYEIIFESIKPLDSDFNLMKQEICRRKFRLQEWYDERKNLKGVVVK